MSNLLSSPQTPGGTAVSCYATSLPLPLSPSSSRPFPVRASVTSLKKKRDEKHSRPLFPSPLDSTCFEIQDVSGSKPSDSPGQGKALKAASGRCRGRRLCRRRGASWAPPRGGAAEVRHCPVPVRCSGWGSVPGSAAPGSLVSRQAPVCGAGRRSPRTGGPQEGVLAEARVAAAQLSPSVLVANARRLGAERLHVKHGVCLMRFLD